MKKLVIVAAVAAVIGAAGCQKMQEPADQAVVDEAAKADTLSVSVPSVVIGDNAWTVEVAVSPEELGKGLGGRESLSPKMGMWFVFTDDSMDPFWMRDTNFDLDMVFVDADMKVVDVKLNNKALTETLVEPRAPYRFVLEVPAGEAAAVAVGDAVEYRLGPN